MVFGRWITFVSGRPSVEATALLPEPARPTACPSATQRRLPRDAFCGPPPGRSPIRPHAPLSPAAHDVCPGGGGGMPPPGVRGGGGGAVRAEVQCRVRRGAELRPPPPHTHTFVRLRRGQDKKPRFVWLDNGNAFSAFGTDELNGAKTIKMLCSACKFAAHGVRAARGAVAGACPGGAGGRGQLLGAADAQTAHPATFSTAPTHQLLGSANAETTPAGAPAAAADRTQRSDATCEGKNGGLSRAP